MGIKEGIKGAAKEYMRGVQMIGDDVTEIVTGKRPKRETPSQRKARDKEMERRNEGMYTQPFSGTMKEYVQEKDTFKQYKHGGMVSTKGNGKAIRTKKCKMM